MWSTNSSRFWSQEGGRIYYLLRLKIENKGKKELSECHFYSLSLQRFTSVLINASSIIYPASRDHLMFAFFFALGYMFAFRDLQIAIHQQHFWIGCCLYRQPLRSCSTKDRFIVNLLNEHSIKVKILFLSSFQSLIVIISRVPKSSP